MSSSNEIGLLIHPLTTPSIPLPLRPGDHNIDGFPDLVIIVANSTGSPGGIFGTSRRSGTQVRILENVPCGKGIAGCDSAHSTRRGLRVAAGRGWEALDEIWDVSGASWIDIDDDVGLPADILIGERKLMTAPQGSLDLLIQRSGAQSGARFTFIQNNFYNDAFFVKAQGMSFKPKVARECSRFELMNGRSFEWRL